MAVGDEALCSSQNFGLRHSSLTAELILCFSFASMCHMAGWLTLIPSARVSVTKLLDGHPQQGFQCFSPVCPGEEHHPLLSTFSGPDEMRGGLFLKFQFLLYTMIHPLVGALVHIHCGLCLDVTLKLHILPKA